MHVREGIEDPAELCLVERQEVANPAALRHGVEVRRERLHLPMSRISFDQLARASPAGQDENRAWLVTVWLSATPSTVVQTLIAPPNTPAGSRVESIS